MKTKHTNLLILSALVILLSSCRASSADVDRAIETFLMFIVQIVAFVLFGISSVVLSIISSLASTKSSTPKLIGIILVSIFSFITIICLMITFEINPKRNFIYFAFFVDAIAICISFIFLFKPKETISTQVTQQVYSTEQLDEIIEAKPVKNADGLEKIEDLD